MIINKIEYFEGIDNLIGKIRKTKLMGSDTEVYKRAFMDLESIGTQTLVPCQTYILKKQLEVLSEINRASMLHCGIHLCDLEGYLQITTSAGTTTLTPTIIERDSEFGYKIINDGMHRIFWAIKNGEPLINCIYIQNPSDPYYAYPLEAGWDDVTVFEDSIPEDFIKKYHRIKDYKTLYRDFNTAFKYPVGKPRGKGKQ